MTAFLMNSGCSASTSGGEESQTDPTHGEKSRSTGAAAAQVVVTSPKLKVVKNLQVLFENGILDENRISIVGLYPVADADEYVPVIRYVKKHKLRWMDLEKFECAVADGEIFAENACTSYFRDLFLGSSGMIFTGGPDIPPAYFGEKTLPETEIRDPERHRFEISFLYHLLSDGRGARREPLLAMNPDFPIFGLCLGMQSMNVALGGTLVQDIPTQLYAAKTLEDAAALPEPHRDARHLLDPRAFPEPWVVHDLAWPGRPAFGATGEGVRVLSNHHQSIDRMGQGLETLATGADGKVVEVIGHARYPNVVGIQFHAEYREVWADDADRPEERRLREADREFHRKLWAGFAAALR